MFNDLVAKKVQESFFIPVEIREMIEPLIKQRSIKKKWMIYVAALAALAELSEEEVSDRIGEVALADSTGDFAQYVERRRIGKEQVFRRAAKPKSEE